MWHGEALRHHLVALDVDQDPAGRPAIAPPVGDVRSRHRGRITRTAAGQRHAIEVAPILGSEARDEAWLPDRGEAVTVADRGDAAEQAADEHRPAVRAEADIMGIDIPGH